MSPKSSVVLECVFSREKFRERYDLISACLRVMERVCFRFDQYRLKNVEKVQKILLDDRFKFNRDTTGW